MKIIFKNNNTTKVCTKEENLNDFLWSIVNENSEDSTIVLDCSPSFAFKLGHKWGKSIGEYIYIGDNRGKLKLNPKYPLFIECDEMAGKIMGQKINSIDLNKITLKESFAIGRIVSYLQYEINEGILTLNMEFYE